MPDQTDRRTFGKLVLSSCGLTAARAAARIDSTFKGVPLGIHTYSLRDRPLDAAIQAMTEIGAGVCELGLGHVYPGKMAGSVAAREKIREWMASAPLSLFEAIGQKFRAAGIRLYGYTYGFREEFTDQEIERGFLMARALGAEVLTASANVSTALRIDRFARKYKMRVGMHNHSRIRENEFATPADFDRARQGTSDYIAINLDAGHFVAAGFDPLELIEKHHSDIVSIHIKDRKKNQGPHVPFGEGDVPLREILVMLRDRKYGIPANIEYEYEAPDTVVEAKRCFEFCRRILLA